jgi:hypothetical protein
MRGWLGFVRLLANADHSSALSPRLPSPKSFFLALRFALFATCCAPMTLLLRFCTPSSHDFATQNSINSPLCSIPFTSVPSRCSLLYPRFRLVAETPHLGLRNKSHQEKSTQQRHLDRGKSTQVALVSSITLDLNGAITKRTSDTAPSCKVRDNRSTLSASILT